MHAIFVPQNSKSIDFQIPKMHKVYSSVKIIILFNYFIRLFYPNNN